MLDIDKIISQAIKKDATDIHFVLESKPMYRIGKSLVNMEGSTKLENEDMYQIYNYVIDGNLAKEKLFNEAKTLDTIYKYNDINLGVNLSYSNRVPVCTMKIMKNELPEYKELGLPEIVRKVTNEPQGLILVTGKNKSGKTTTLNALVRHINETQNKKILTLEKTIKYRHTSRNSMIVQKEVGARKDCLTYVDGITNAIEEDCDVLIIGEIKDRETMDAVLEMVESGHLVIAALHTENCIETIDKIVNFYNKKDQAQIKYLLSKLLKLVISQRLLTGEKAKIELAPEVMVVDDKIAELIRQEKIDFAEIEKAIHNSSESISLINSLAKLYVENKITLKQAKTQLEESEVELLNNTIMKMRLLDKKKGKV